LLAEGWVPTRDISSIQVSLRRATETAGTTVPPILHEIRTSKAPPTFHRTNKFTEAYQAIIDNYGVATYQEVNPGLFAVITFPFLFAVMFGDLGHGFIALLAAIGMIVWEKQIARSNESELFGMMFYGRYIILFMGAFSMYTGLIYNDFFSKSMRLWDSGWEFQGNGTAVPTGHLYPIGMDPAWNGSDNALVFINSYKMKMSIIFGVIHMTFAICLQVPNHIFFKRLRNIYAEFIPQILFLHSIFGYLVVCIIIKWCTDWETSPTGPPNLLNMLIDMFLSPGTLDPATQLFAGQRQLQVFLLLLAMVCVPWMLCMKPYLMWRDMKKIKEQGYSAVHDYEDGNGRHSNGLAEEERADPAEVIQDGKEHDEHDDFSEVIIHQVIHTIEFCLGCISNTASYLRLWALSLAHAQLSEVLWDMTIKEAFGMTGIFGAVFLVIMFAMWLSMTVMILCVMEGLSAFLHALRLHWVEANGKHYEGGGYPFSPLTFVIAEESS